jgi:hypothetical protein
MALFGGENKIKDYINTKIFKHLKLKEKLLEKKK